MPIVIGLFVAALLISVWFVLKVGLLILFVAAMIVVICMAIFQDEGAGLAVGVPVAIVFLLIVFVPAKKAFDESTKVPKRTASSAQQEESAIVVPEKKKLGMDAWSTKIAGTSEAPMLDIRAHAQGEGVRVVCYLDEVRVNSFWSSTKWRTVPAGSALRFEFPKDFLDPGEQKPDPGLYSASCSGESASYDLPLVRVGLFGYRFKSPSYIDVSRQNMTLPIESMYFGDAFIGKHLDFGQRYTPSNPNETKAVWVDVGDPTVKLEMKTYGKKRFDYWRAAQWSVTAFGKFKGCRRAKDDPKVKHCVLENVACKQDVLIAKRQKR